MITMKNIVFGAWLVLFIFIVNSCRKDNEADNTDVIHVQLNNTGEIISNDVYKLFLYSMMSAEDSIFHPNDSLNFRFNEPCLVMQIVPYDTITWPKTITLDFPTNNCIGYDGLIRSGQLIITATGSLYSLNSVFTIALQNYSVNTISVSGIKKLSVNNITAGKPVAFTDSCFFQVGTLTTNYSWQAQHILQWILGSSTEDNLSDDLFIYSGTSASGSFNGLITDALQFGNYCFWIGSGKIEISPESLSKRQVTYPDSCLNQADVLINNQTLRIDL